MSKKSLTLIILIVLIAIGGGYYWFFVRVPSSSVTGGSGSNGNSSNGIFAPFGQGGQSSANTATTTNASPGTTTIPVALAVPALREISSMPVGGMTSSSTASTTILRWIDRGTGHIYQAYADNTAIDELSNTTVPMIYGSYWDTAANAFIFNSLSDTTNVVSTFYAILTPVPAAEAPAASTSPSTVAQSTPYSLTGSPLSSKTLALAVSPSEGKTGNQVFTLVSDGNGGAAGYVSNFDGSKKTQIFDSPLTELNVQWPAADIIALTTKGTSSAAGFLYFVNPKNGIFNEVIGGLNGLSTLANGDASEVLYSHSDAAGTGIVTAVYNVATGQSQDLPFDTLAEKCVWSALQKTDLYCAIPSNVPAAAYPDAWYQGTVSFDDSIWEIDTVTGDVHELVDLTKTAGQPIDAENLQLSPREDFLYFMNKKDLSLWSFDLNAI